MEQTSKSDQARKRIVGSPTSQAEKNTSRHSTSLRAASLVLAGSTDKWPCSWSRTNPNKTMPGTYSQDHATTNRRFRMLPAVHSKRMIAVTAANVPQAHGSTEPKARGAQNRSPTSNSRDHLKKPESACLLMSAWSTEFCGGGVIKTSSYQRFPCAWSSPGSGFNQMLSSQKTPVMSRGKVRPGKRTISSRPNRVAGPVENSRCISCHGVVPTVDSLVTSRQARHKGSYICNLGPLSEVMLSERT